MKKLISAFFLGMIFLTAGFTVDKNTGKAEVEKYLADENAEYADLKFETEGQHINVILKAGQMQVFIFTDEGMALVLGTRLLNEDTLPLKYADISSIKYVAPVLKINYTGNFD